MKKKQYYQALAAMLLIILVLSAVCLLGGVILLIRRAATPPEGQEGDTQPDLPTDLPTDSEELLQTPDAGLSYQDSLIFFGESTTAHLASRGVLSGGQDTDQVWKDASGTQNLDSGITSRTIIYPPTGESMTVAEACALAKPDYLVLSFGLNGIVAFANDKALFINSYNRLINAVKQASPDTRIILQTVYPIALTNNDFSVDAMTVNRYIMTLNTWIPEIAAAHENVRYADTASVLRMSDQALYPSYDAGDGIHLTAAAYEKVLQYLRTHAWQAAS